MLSEEFEGISLQYDRWASQKDAPVYRVYEAGQFLGKVAEHGSKQRPWVIVNDSYRGREFENKRVAAKALAATRRLLTPGGAR